MRAHRTPTRHRYGAPLCILIHATANRSLIDVLMSLNDQEWASHVLNLPASKITCHVKRLGGGFGGKETRCLIYSSAVAVAAHHLKRPVRIAVKRDLDMASSGQRAVCYSSSVKHTITVTSIDCMLECNPCCTGIHWSIQSWLLQRCQAQGNEPTVL